MFVEARPNWNPAAKKLETSLQRSADQDDIHLKTEDLPDFQV